MYEKILVPTDGTKAGAQGENHGIDMAAALGASIVALHVIEEGGNPWLSQSMDDQMDEARAYAQDILNDFAERAEAEGVEVETEIEVGPDVYEEINEVAEEEGVDAIVMGRGYRGSMGSFLGSTAERVIRTSEVPVTVIQTRGD